MCAVPAGDFAGLSEDEYELMRCLLYGGDYSALIRGGAMLSLLADSINEKLFDIFGDTVLEYSEEQLRTVEDYSDQLKGIIVP